MTFRPYVIMIKNGEISYKFTLVFVFFVFFVFFRLLLV